ANKNTAAVRASVAEQLDRLIHLVQVDGVDRLEYLALVLLRKCHFALNSPVSASAPYSTESSANPAGTTSIRAADQSVIRRRSSSRSGPNSASPALLIPPPITIRAGFTNMIQAFNPSVRSTTYSLTNAGSCINSFALLPRSRSSHRPLHMRSKHPCAPHRHSDPSGRMTTGPSS